MKTVIFGLLLSVGAHAATSQDADALYATRGENYKNALEAANLYDAAAGEARSSKDLVDNKLGVAKALYYYGNKVSSKRKKRLFIQEHIRLLKPQFQELCF